MARKGGRLYLSGTSSDIRRMLQSIGLRPPRAQYAADIDAAVAAARRDLAVDANGPMAGVLQPGGESS
jgi:sulfate permease, SulP family